MLSYIKSNKSLITKMLLYQIGGAMLGLAMTFAAGKQTLFIITSSFSVLFYLYIMYIGIWDEAGKERIRIDGGRAEMKPLRGLCCALVANIPNFVLALITIPTYYLCQKTGPALEWAGNIHSIAYTICLFWQGTYIGFVRMFSPNNPFGFLLTTIPGILMATFSYVMGVNNKYLLGFLHKKQR